MGEQNDREEELAESELRLKLAEIFHEHGLSLPTRTIYLGAEEDVDYEMAERFIKNLHILESLSGGPVTVLANNPGGDIYHGLAIYDAIKLSPCKVKMVVRGHAMSMGSLILQAADERVMGPTSTQMIHYGTMGISAHAKTFLKWADENRRLDEWSEEVYLIRMRVRRPKFTLKALRALLDHDSFFTAERSVEFGLADSIG